MVVAVVDGGEVVDVVGAAGCWECETVPVRAGVAAREGDGGAPSLHTRSAITSATSETAHDKATTRLTARRGADVLRLASDASGDLLCLVV